MTSKLPDSEREWFVYILRCADDSLYTGITTDVNRRVLEHNSGKRGASYTRGRRPVKLAYCQISDNRSTASQSEARIKRMSRTHKERLIADYKLAFKPMLGVDQ